MWISTIYNFYHENDKKEYIFYVYHYHIYHHTLLRHIRLSNFRSRDCTFVHNYSCHNVGHNSYHNWISRILKIIFMFEWNWKQSNRPFNFINICILDRQNGWDLVYVMHFVCKQCTFNNIFHLNLFANIPYLIKTINGYR